MKNLILTLISFLFLTMNTLSQAQIVDAVFCCTKTVKGCVKDNARSCAFKGLKAYDTLKECSRNCGKQLPNRPVDK